MQGVVHVVSYGYASSRNRDATVEMLKAKKLSTIAKAQYFFFNWLNNQLPYAFLDPRVRYT